MSSYNQQALADIRANIDGLDRELVRLIGDREQLVRQAGRLKADTDAVRAPERVEAVITRVCAVAEELGASPMVVERTYRSMIAAFIELELDVHQDTHTSGPPSP
jgi:isochorismate pyruvate lyase